MRWGLNLIRGTKEEGNTAGVNLERTDILLAQGLLFVLTLSWTSKPAGIRYMSLKYTIWNEIFEMMVK